ncbi:hypothetical protein [Hydrogenophaga sp.]|uniref:hypothetical protein n=1 Tax=Hydrogenophaga sp. TaxID=1904254 RepID=UPI0035B45F43
MMKSLRTRLLPVALVVAAASFGPSVSLAQVVMAGSHVASTEVACVPGSDEKINNWVRACRLSRNQTFNRVTVRNPGMPPTTTPMACPAGNLARFDEYGYITSCTP